MKNVPLSKLMHEYAIEWERSFDEYYSVNAKKANRHFFNAYALYDEIESRGAEGRSAIVELLKHPHIRVRVMTAVRAIDLVPELAVPVLEAPETRVYPWESINAKSALRDWRGKESNK